MVDAVGTITKIVEVALKIKKAADTVKQNEDECMQIKDRVEVLSSTLSQHQENAELMNNFAVRAALEALGETLGEALGLVTECQETKFVCLLCTAGSLSKKLTKLEQRISNKNMDAMFAMMSFFLPNKESTNRDNSRPPDPQVYSSGRQAMQPPSPPKQMWRQNQDGHDVNVQTDDSVPGYFVGRTQSLSTNKANTQVYEEVNPVSQWDSSMGALCSCCAMAQKRKPIRRPSSTPDGQPPSLLCQIEEVAFDIKEASETVLQYKKNCTEIGKRVRRVSALLSQLENTEMVEEQAMKDELNKLLETFCHARTLVMVCQSSGIVTMFVCSPPCILSKQLSALLDQLVPHVNAIIAVIVNSSTPRPQRSIPTENVGESENNDANCSLGARSDTPDLPIKHSSFKGSKPGAGILYEVSSAGREC
ncbi:unnamed protein product [Urochloa humidicola]